MQPPISKDDVRFISVDGNRVRLELASGFLEVTFDSPEVMERVLRKGTAAGGRHTMYQDGILGI